MKCARYRKKEQLQLVPRGQRWVIELLQSSKNDNIFIPFDVFFNKATLLFAASIDWLLFVEYIE